MLQRYMEEFEMRFSIRLGFMMAAFRAIGATLVELL